MEAEARKTFTKLCNKFVPKGERREFRKCMKVTRAGEHPAFMKLLHCVAQKIEAQENRTVEHHPV